MSPAKRVMDVFVALLALALLSPIMLLIALVIRIADGGPALYWQQRVGRNGTLFTLWKFRTLVPTADRGGMLLTLAGDARITRVGAWLRATRLDELPQLFNVLVGDMTLVGPRPEVPRYVAHYSPEQRRSLDWVPGLTDPATLEFADQDEVLAAATDPVETYLQVVMPARLRIAIEYAEQATLVSDLAVLAQTLRRLWWRS